MTAQGVALVTGAGRGIGRGIAERLARDGFTIAVNDVNAQGAADTVRRIQAAGRQAQPFTADVSDSQQVEALVKNVEQQLGEVQILVNNAGLLSAYPIVDLHEDEWDRILGVNLRGMFLCCKAVVRRMIAPSRSGRIINIASEVGKTGQAYITHYCASKAGVIGFTQSLAMELAPHGVTVNSVCPTLTDTDMIAEHAVDQANLRGGTREEWLATFHRMAPLGRMGKPEDVAGVVAFLASPDAGFVTGASYNVTGGNEVH